MMMRWVLVLLASVTILTPATASLSRKQRPDVPKNLPPTALKPLAPTPKNDEFRLTAATEVLLNGRPCRYEDVPDGATILLLETATNESKDILKIHFQTGSRGAASDAVPTEGRTPRR
jgi:hypothetical protein